MRLDDLTAWISANDPDTMPFWPGAANTGGFGLRSSEALLELGASPIHLGNDRAGGGQFTMPFDGRVEWSVVGGVAGTLLRLRSTDARLEVQVFHTEADAGVENIELFMRRGDPLPVTPGDAGLSSGDHTHTEVLLPFDADVFGWLTAGTTAMIREGLVDLWAIRSHCQEHDLPECKVIAAVDEQIRAWQIAELWEHVAVRRTLPAYRAVGWHGPTLLVDSRWLLKI